MVRLEARSSNLIPGVLISPGSEDQFIIHEDLFESMLSQVTSGRTLDPELQPWSDVPVWDAQADNLVFMESNPELLTRHMLAEHLVGTSRELCSYINPRRSGFSQSSLGQPGGLTDFTAGKGSREEPERVTDVVALDIEANVEEILRHAPERLDIPTEVRFPVTLSYGHGFNTGYVASFDYREGRYYRIVRERDQDGSIIERKDNIGGRNE